MSGIYRALSAVPSFTIPALFALLVISISTPAHAQLGGLVRKAKAAATGEASRRSGATAVLEGESVAFNDVVLELTGERVDQVIRGLEAGKAASSDNAKAALVAQRDKISSEAGDLSDKYAEPIAAHNRRFWKVDACRNDAFKSRQESRNKALQAKMLSDADFRARIMDATTRLGAAQMKNDTVALKAIEREFRVMSGESKADTVAVDGACGAALGKHPMDQKVEAMQKEVRDIDARLRDAEQKAAEKEASAAGMNMRQFAMARERIEMYLANVKGNYKQRGLTTTELTALESRRSALAGYFA